MGLIHARVRIFRGFPSADEEELHVEIVLGNGCLFLMKGLIVPPTLRFEGQSYSEGWKLLRSLKSSEIDSRARGCGWNFIFLAEAMRRTVFGLGRAWALRKATNKILADFYCPSRHTWRSRIPAGIHDVDGGV